MRSRLVPVLFLVGLFLALPNGASAQTATLRGFVTDASTGEPLEYVNVVAAEVGTAEARGSTTSGDGAYFFPALPPSTYVVQATFVGYAVFRDTLALEAGDVRALNIALRSEAELLDEVVVQDERDRGVANTVAGQQTIRPAEIELVPSPDLSADLSGYLSTLPAVVTVGDRGGQLFIRGGEPSQNLVLIDGMAVYQPFHMLGFYSAFPAEVLRSAEFFAGGFGARYGGRLSSVLDISTRNGNNRSFDGQATVSPFVSSAQLEGPLYPGHASFLVSARRSFLEEGAERITGTSLPYAFGDLIAKVHLEPSTTTRLSATGLQTYDRGTLAGDPSSPGRTELRWRNTAVGGRFVSLPSFAPFLGELQLSYSRLDSEQGPPGVAERFSSVSELHGSAIGTFYNGRIVDTEAGFTFLAIGMRSELGGAFQNTVAEDANFQNVGAFIEPTITPVGGLTIRPGVRFQFYRLGAYPYVEPRLRVVYERGRHQLSMATGLYHQEIVGLSDRRDATGVFTVWTYTPGVGARADDIRAGRLGRAIHALVGYRVNPLPGLDLSVEGFWKDVDNLFIAEWTSYPRLTTNLQAARGEIFGFDTRASYSRRGFSVQASYGYSNTLYIAERSRYEHWYGDETLRFRPPHDRRHQVNLLAIATVLGVDVSARWQFGSGLPFSRAVGFGGFILMDGPHVDVGAQGMRRIIYERPYNATLPTFHRLDLSAERTARLRAIDLTIQASAINAYDRRNIFFLDVFTLQRSDQLPFVPSLGLKVSTR